VHTSLFFLSLAILRFLAFVNLKLSTCAIIRGSVLKNCPVEIDVMSNVFAGDNTTNIVCCFPTKEKQGENFGGLFELNKKKLFLFFFLFWFLAGVQET